MEEAYVGGEAEGSSTAGRGWMLGKDALERLRAVESADDALARLIARERAVIARK